jgi:hypothetical protein
MLPGLLLKAMIKTADFYNIPRPASTAELPKSTLKSYEDILEPYLIKTTNAQDKACTETRNRNGSDIRMIALNIAVVGAAIRGRIMGLSQYQADKFPIPCQRIFNTDGTGFTLKNIGTYRTRFIAFGSIQETVLLFFISFSFVFTADLYL